MNIDKQLMHQMITKHVQMMITDKGSRLGYLIISEYSLQNQDFFIFVNLIKQMVIPFAFLLVVV